MLDYANKTTRSKRTILLKAGEEIQHNLLELRVRCLRDFAISPARTRGRKLPKISTVKTNNPALNIFFNLLNRSQQVLVLTQYMLQERLLKLGDLAWLHFVQVTPHTSINYCYLLFNSHWG